MSDSLQLPLIAGYNRSGEAVVEQVDVHPVEGTDNEFRLQKSPGFVRGLAADDRIRYPADEPGGYQLMEHSGNLSLRVFTKHSIPDVDRAVTPALELIDGRRDVRSAGMLVYTIHFSIGFKRIEDTLNQALKRFPDSIWYYGNVYDPDDGVTPLNWWQDIAES